MEFALLIPVALMVLLVSIQLAILGQTALSVSQASFAIARYIAVNRYQFSPNSSYNASNATIQSLVAPDLQSNGGADLTVQVTACSSGTTC